MSNPRHGSGKKLIHSAQAQGRSLYVVTYFDSPPDKALLKATLVFKRPEQAVKVAEILNSILDD